MAAIAWRTNLTHRRLADLFDGVATVHRVLDRCVPTSSVSRPGSPARASSQP
ncbi:hypothetical protein AB4Z54_15565 [Streptomyces sp. MCAF7]